MNVCIYCGATGPGTVFTQEHVVSQAFGLFGAQTPTLTDDVCHSCNQTLGREVETPAARGSLEGVHRYLTGLRDEESFAKTPRKRVRFEIAEPGWEGVSAYPVPSPDGSGVLVMFEPQVILEAKDGGEARSVTLAQLQASEHPLENVGRVSIYAKTDQEEEDLLRELAHLNINFRLDSVRRPSVEGGKVRVKYAAVCDVLVSRLMAKIAFNYMCLLGRCS